MLHIFTLERSGKAENTETRGKSTKTKEWHAKKTNSILMMLEKIWFVVYEIILSNILHAGDGKTHCIVEKLKGTHQSQQVTIAVNEAFSYMTAIEKLSSLPSDQNGCKIFFNFTVVPPLVSFFCHWTIIPFLASCCYAGNFLYTEFQVSTHDTENAQYYELMKKVGWFFFDLLVLGYVEDPSSGKSFYFPANLSWNLFIEVHD